MTTTESALRTKFFTYLFGDTKGYLCIAIAQPSNRQGTFRQYFFNWPEQKSNVESFLDANTHRKDVWFCTSLLERAERKKEFCLPGRLVWADLDECDPETVSPAPPCIIESSPSRFQALWRLTRVVEPYVQESYSKRVAYAYSQNGSDLSGWDLTQLLRVPLTYNYKYEEEGLDVPEVKLVRSLETLAEPSLFEELPDVTKPSDPQIEATPDLDSLPNPENVIYAYGPQLRSTAFTELFTVEPSIDSDWSRVLWRLIMICLESGMTNEEAFAICLVAKCNKYARDNRPPYHLWQDILRADATSKKLVLLTSATGFLKMPELVNEDELEDLPQSFIEDYKEWAEVATDAVAEYHELSAAILLSAVIAGGVTCETSYGPMVPNLWGMILGDSTLTRKTTAMRMVMDIITDVNPDILLATDGSAEGLLTGLSLRPNQTSIFYKDELSGFVDSINRKDYLAGMPETLTQLYDVPKYYTRRLRKETISITSPVFIFFGGGIRDKIYSLLSDEYVLSGFLPRFLVVSGEADISRIRRTGPATDNTFSQRADIVERMKGLYNDYTGTVEIEVFGQSATVNREIKATLSPDAWERYGKMEMQMVQAANEAENSMLALPTFERLSRSILKLSVLLAAARKSATANNLAVDNTDIIQAAFYVQRWGRHSIDLLSNVGKNVNEKLLDRIVSVVERNPGIQRGPIMRQFHLSKRQMDEIHGTLVDRGLLVASKQGRGFVYKAV